MHFEVSRHVAAPAPAVWAIVADVANSGRVVSAIDAIEMVAGPSPVEVGTVWRETRTMLGRRATEEMTVYAVDPGRSYTVRAHSGGMEIESTITVAPDGEADSTVTIALGARSTSTASRLLGATVGRAFAGATRNALEQDLADIASAAELGPAAAAGGADESGGRPTGP
jgi:carbon monoxide dehydrogenase subunit G